MKFTVSGSTIKTMNGDYEAMRTGLVLKTTTEGEATFQKPLKPDIARVINWMVVFGSPGVIRISGKLYALATGNGQPILNAMGFHDWPMREG